MTAKNLHSYKKWYKIGLGLPLIVNDLVYKFQMICKRGTDKLLNRNMRNWIFCGNISSMERVVVRYPNLHINIKWNFTYVTNREEKFQNGNSGKILNQTWPAFYGSWLYKFQMRYWTAVKVKKQALGSKSVN